MLYRLLVAGFALGMGAALIALLLGWGLHDFTFDLTTLPDWSAVTFEVCVPISLFCGLILWLTAPTD